MTVHREQNMKREDQQDATILFNRTETFIVITAPHNRYQQHPAEPEQHTKCSNRAFDLLKMGIMMPETC